MNTNWTKNLGTPDNEFEKKFKHERNSVLQSKKAKAVTVESDYYEIKK